LLRVVEGGKTGSERVRASIASAALAGAEVFADTLSSYAVPLRSVGITTHNRFNSSEAAAD
jgi:hypothetical protein